MPRLYDLTHPLGPDAPVYPGDPPVRVEGGAVLAERGYRTSVLRFGTHAGTHVDAPAHLLPDGPTVDRISLEVWVGPALLADVAQFEAQDPAGVERVLLAGCSGGLPPAWAERLARGGVRLVGVDSPSVDDISAPDLPVHRLLLASGAVLVENLRMAGVPRGWGTLYCLPLAVAGGDGAPARVLWKPRAGGRP